ncbi:BQ5605_C013g07380 [Microbotryum silenes-dioicae]|uniref:BQ5605_C013g07380 protein n=1 Tax=Microbotryum silenes-dioicae TaxID=796604 RepID=A0A2X0LV93_9BASI|nr:BQ5605_C013g07380 [Microbotryum silenes-dioicae]
MKSWLHSGDIRGRHGRNLQGGSQLMEGHVRFRLSGRATPSEQAQLKSDPVQRFNQHSDIPMPACAQRYT